MISDAVKEKTAMDLANLQQVSYLAGMARLGSDMIVDHMKSLSVVQKTKDLS